MPTGRPDVSANSTIEIAVYQGDDFITSGNIHDVAKELGVRADTLYFYTMPTYQRRLERRRQNSKRANVSENVRRVVRLDQDDEEDL